MKKLGVIFLATVFVFGLASQVNALDWFDNEAAFDQGEDVISFDSLLRGTEIGATYEGVTFFDLYAEDWISYYVYGQFVGDAMGAGGRSATASNINIYTYGAPLPEIVAVQFDPPGVTLVGFFAGSPNGGQVLVNVYRGDDETGWEETGSIVSPPTPTAPDEMIFVGMEDPQGINKIEISGYGNYGTLWNSLFIDDFRFGGAPATGPAEIEVIMNVKPLNCAGASINVKSKGVTPVVIVGTEDLDVTMIDLSSVELQGAAPVRSAVEDVANCKSPGLDGYPDLVLKFDTQELVRGMQASQKAGVTLENDDWPLLRLTGSLSDGTLIYADQVVSVKGKAEEVSRGKQKGKK